MNVGIEAMPAALGPGFPTDLAKIALADSACPFRRRAARIDSNADVAGIIMAKTWYNDGLHFECTRCGDCCTGAPGFVWVTDEEIAAIAELRGEPVEEVTAMYTRVAHRGRTLREKPNGDCVFYDRGEGCTIYPVRPSQCRTWPFWESNIRTPEAWERTKKVCPGSGQGELIPVEEITRRVRKIDL